MRERQVVWLIAAVLFVLLTVGVVLAYNENVDRIRAYNLEHFGITDVDVDPLTATPGFWLLLVFAGALAIVAPFVFERKKAAAAIVAAAVLLASVGIAYSTAAYTSGGTMWVRLLEDGPLTLPMRLIFDATAGDRQSTFNDFFTDHYHSSPMERIKTFYYNLQHWLNITPVSSDKTWSEACFWDHQYYMAAILQDGIRACGGRYDEELGFYVWDPKPSCYMLCFVIGEENTDARGVSVPEWNAMIVKQQSIAEDMISVAEHEFGHQLYCTHCGNICMMNPNGYLHFSCWCESCRQTVNDHLLKWWH